ncbi:hypothetical protein [Halocynthiibacter namhaensis]|uniref:hypothetical protein n=1 Tax=Halocynthiibacter namhaensis TaxID=1290553 RepID=UPI0005799323|nr:hypothetical protein [Halocynthiibacter namhaensis]
MKRLIYQYWTGRMPSYAQVSKELFTSYARDSGAEYLFEQDPRYFRSKYARYYNALRPIFDLNFHAYDQVLFVDMDVIPLQNNDANIFETPIGQIGMVEEVDQPDLRLNMFGRINHNNDLRWAKVVKKIWGVQVPLDALNRPRVFNSGVVLYTKTGLQFARENFPSVKAYQYVMTLARLPRFYRLDQNYLGAFVGKHRCDYSCLASDWNSQITSAKTLSGENLLVDQRTASSKFIHMQHRGRNEMSQDDVLSVASGTYNFDAARHF